MASIRKDTLEFYEAAINGFSTAIKLDGSTKRFVVDNYKDRAAVYVKCGKLEKAAQDYENALKIQPSVLIYNLLTDVYLKLNQFDNALECYNQVIKLEPDN